MPTTLSAGDIAIIGYNSDDPDTFSFVLLEDITVGTVINFTDQSWNGTAFVSAGSDSTITFTASANMTAGTVITSAHAGFAGGTLNLDAAGDHIIAYQNSPATPTFLYAINFADGNTDFAGTLPTGLTLGTTAIAVALDNAYYGGQFTGIEQTQLTLISNVNNWESHDTVRQTPQSGPALPPDTQIWVTTTGGSGGGIAHVDENSNIASNLARYFEANNFAPANHPTDIAFDTVHGKVFVASANGFTNQILEFDIAELLTPGVTPTATVLWTETVGTINNGIRELDIDVDNADIYFTRDQQMYRVDYNPTGPSVLDASVTTVTDLSDDPTGPFGAGSTFAFEFDLNLASGFAYFIDVEFQNVFNPDPPPEIITAGLENAIYQVNLSTGAVTRLNFSPDDFNEGGTLPLESFPEVLGLISDVVVDDRGTAVTTDDRLIFTTISSNGGDSGVYVYNLNGNPTGTYTTLWTQPSSGSLDGENSTIQEIEVNPSEGAYYITIHNSLNNGTTGIYRGSLSGGTPTLFQAINATTSGAAQATGITLDNQPTLALTLLGSTPIYTETAGSPSAAGTPIAIISAADTNDIDTTQFDDHLAGATIAITNNFVSGDRLTINGDADGIGSLLSGISFSYNAVTGVLTLTGPATFEEYEAALQLVQFTNAGDNPTNYGANQTRTVSWTVTDGLISSDVQTSTVNISAVNDAPVNVVGGTAVGNEDATFAITGISVSDVDADPASQDITVTLTVTRGTLSVDETITNGLVAGDISGNGTNSVVLTGTQNEINATLAGLNGLTFTGGANVNGTVTLTVLTNDGGFTGSSGSLTDSDDKTITVTAVNDAPTVAGDGTETLGAVDEDASSPAGASVSSLFGGQFSDATDDQSGFPGGSSPNAFAGIAVVVNGSSAGTGQWQYFNGSSWVDIGAASTASAQLINAATLIRFNPAPDFNGPAPTLTAHLVDASGSAFVDGLDANLTAATGGTTRYSTGTVTLDTSVNAINDAPEVVGGNAVLAAIDEDTAEPPGDSVFDLFNSHFSDAQDTVSGGSSANAFAGIAIAGNAATTEGTWQYRDGIGGSWTALPPVSAGSALVLATNAELRFVPAANYSGAAPTLTVHLIDDSAGTVATGDTADVSTTGDPTQYSASLTLGETVTSINDAPVAVDSAANGTEDQTLTFTLAHFQFTDPNDTPADDLASVTITSLPAGGTLTLLGNPITAPDLPVTVTRAQIIAGDLTFVPTGDANGTGYASFTFTVQDDGGTVGAGADDTSNNSATLTINLDAVNDPVTITPDTDTAAYTENDDPVQLLGPVTLTDVDNSANFNGGTVTVALANTVAGDQLAFVTGSLYSVSGTDVLFDGTVIGSVTAGGLGDTSITITLDADATLSVVDGLLEAFAFFSTSENPTNAQRTATVTFNDGGNTGTGVGTDSSTITINVTAENDPPTAVITEATYATLPSVSIDLRGTGLSVGDVDGGPPGIETVTLSVTNGTLTVTAGASGVTVTNSPSGSVTITGTIAQINALFSNDADALSEVSFVDTSPVGPVTLTLEIDDGGNTGGAAESASDTAIINVDFPPDVTPTPANAPSYTEQQTTPAAILVDATISISDADPPGSPPEINSATVEISDFVTGDLLSADAGTTGINVFWNAATHTLELTNGGTLADYQQVLRTVTYTSSGDNPTNFGASPTRTITWVINDNFDVPSAPETTTIAITGVNDAPTAAAGGTASYTEQAAAVVVDNTVTLGDLDSSNLIGATVTISGGLQPGDTLNFINQNGISLVSFVGGVLTLTGSATVAQYQTALRSITFDNLTNEDPTNGGANTSRTITWQVDDGSGSDNTSNSPTSTINITAGNDTPTAVITPPTYVATENVALNLKGTGLSVGDDDASGADVSVTLSVTEGILNVTAGGSLANVSGSGTGTVTITGTIAQINALLDTDGTSTVEYVEDDDTPSATVTLTLAIDDLGHTGASNETASDTAIITITATNDVPALDLDASGAGTGFTAAFTEAGPAVSIADTDTSIIDPDSATIASAIITLTNKQTGDVLSIAGVLPGGITSSIVEDANTITVTLSNAASAADYEAAIEQIQFSNPGAPPSTVSRNITVVVNDGTDPSNVAVSTILIAVLAAAPTDLDLSNTTIAENSANGTVVGTFTTTDANVGDTFTYTLNDNAGGRFAIVGANLVVANHVLLDFEQNTSHSVSVRVTDSDDLWYDETFIITVADVNPEAVGGTPAPDTIFGGALGDSINGAGDNDLILGGGGDDALGGGSGDDTILGQDGNDTIWGEDGNDTLAGNAGDDIMIGGAGDDQIGGDDGNDTINAGDGNDTVFGGAGDDAIGGGIGDDILVGMDGNDTLWGEDGNDIMNGGADNDILVGGAGNDAMGGGTGNDTLLGDAGNDTLWGEDGDDTLFGGTNNDVLIGGGGNDTFVFTAGDGNDIIADFAAGGVDDRIWFTGTDLHNFIDVLSHASFNAGTGATTITYNGTNTVTLNGVAPASLTAGDFIFS